MQDIEHSANLQFAECLPKSTRQIDDTRRNKSLPSAGHLALGKSKLCRVPKVGHSAKPTLPSATRPALGKQNFAECLRADTQQSLSRAPHPTVTPFPRPLPLYFAECQVGDTRQTTLCRVQSFVNAECIILAIFAECPH